MYGIEGAPLDQDGSAYEDVDALTVQWLQAELERRSKGDGAKHQVAPKPTGLHPETIR